MSTSVKEILDTLTPEEKRLLSYAFEHEQEAIVELPNKKYVGVNTTKIKRLIPELIAGVWSAGRIK